MSLQNQQLYEDEAFLIRSIPYGDHHRILAFLTSAQGRIDAIAYAAQNSRKRFSGALDFIHCLKICIKPGEGQRLANLVSCDLQEDFTYVRESYSASITALEWIRLISKAIPQQQKVEGAYALLKTSLIHLQDNSFNKIDLQFRFKLLEILGFRLQLSCCSKCLSPEKEKFYFYLEAGGLLCEQCAPDLKGHALSPYDFVTELPQAFQSQAPLRQVLDEAFSYFLDIQPQSREYGHF